MRPDETLSAMDSRSGIRRRGRTTANRSTIVSQSKTDRISVVQRVWLVEARQAKAYRTLFDIRLHVCNQHRIAQQRPTRAGQ
jgi:hypothetical protein